MNVFDSGPFFTERVLEWQSFPISTRVWVLIDQTQIQRNGKIRLRQIRIREVRRKGRGHVGSFTRAEREATTGIGPETEF